MIKKIIYLSRSSLNHSVNSVYIDGLRKNGIEVVGLKTRLGNVAGLVSFYLKNVKNTDLVMVGYDSPQFAVLAKLLGADKVVYNALCSVYERLIVSRGLSSRYSSKALYFWLLDFLAVHSADFVMVETNQQAEYFKKLFRVSDEKLLRAWTGSDEENFYYNEPLPKYNDFTVFFRGTLMPEAGAECVVAAAKILENSNIKFIMASNGLEWDKINVMVNNLNPKNLEWITDFLPFEKIREMMLKSHLALGQLSSHERLDRTIPHKAFESLAMKMPYLTADNKGVRELLQSGETCITCRPADSKSLAEKILWARDNQAQLAEIGERGYALYQTQLRPEILAKNILNKINGV